VLPAGLRWMKAEFSAALLEQVVGGCRAGSERSCGDWAGLKRRPV
jgi:hypothetical protein